MRMILALVLGLSLVGCATKRDFTAVTEQVSDNGVHRIQDKSTGATCYVYRDGDGSSISCVCTSACK